MSGHPAEQRVRPFSNGSQFRDWQARNCDRCTKFDELRFTGACEIDGALFEAQCGDGSMTEVMGARLGYSDETATAYTWDCPERVLR